MMRFRQNLSLIPEYAHKIKHYNHETKHLLSQRVRSNYCHPVINKKWYKITKSLQTVLFRGYNVWFYGHILELMRYFVWNASGMEKKRFLWNFCFLRGILHIKTHHCVYEYLWKNKKKTKNLKKKVIFNIFFL